MTISIQQWDSNASRRIIPLWCVQSNGTSAATNEAGGQPQFMMGGVYKGATANTLSAWSANAGEYYIALTASEISVLGQGVVRYSSATALEVSGNFQVVANDPYGQNMIVSSGKTLAAGSTTTATLNSAETGTNAWANGCFIAIQLHSGLVVGNVISASTGTLVQFLNTLPAACASGDTYVILPGTVDNFSGLSIAPAPGTYSNVTVQPGTLPAGTYSNVTVQVNGIAPGDYSSAVTVGIGAIKAGTYSGVTVGINNITAGNYSGVTISGVTVSNNLDKTAYSINSIVPATYSGVTVGSLATIPAGDYSSSITFGVGSIKAGTYSGVTLGVNNIAAGNYSGVTISGTTVTNMLPSAGTQVAVSLLSTNLGNTRYVQEAFFVMRNKVDATGSVGTVYQTDDATSAFTFSTTTGIGGIVKFDPAG